MSSDAFDPQLRELCVDGACIGLIGPDGTCKVCRKPGLGVGIDPRSRGLRSAEEIAEPLAAAVIAGDLPEAPEAFEDRQLCPDDLCIGVIGPDQRCSACGRAP